MAIPPSAELKLPRELPAATVVTATDMLVGDNGVVVQKVTPPQIVNAATPVPSQSEAEAGVDNNKRMTPLRVSQAISFQAVASATLSADTGATLVGAVGGLTVQAELDNLKQADSDLQDGVDAAVSDANTAISTANAASLAVGSATSIANDALAAVNDLSTSSGGASIGLAQGGSVKDAVKWVTPEAFGAVGDGVTDDTAALAASFNYASANGYDWRGKAGSTYRLASDTTITRIGSPYPLNIDLNGSTLALDNAFLRFAAWPTAFLTTSLTVNPVYGDAKLTLASTTGMVAGDIVQITSPADAYTDTTVVHYYVVHEVDGLDVYIEGTVACDINPQQIIDSGKTGDIIVNVRHQSSDLSLRNGSITLHSPDGNDTAVYIAGGANVIVSDLVTTGQARNHIYISHTGSNVVTRVFPSGMGYIVKDEGYVNLPTQPDGLGYGYGIIHSNNARSRVSDCHGKYGWHTFDAAVGEMDIIYSNCSTERNAFGYSLHGGSWKVQYNNCSADGGSGFTIGRGYDVTINGFRGINFQSHGVTYDSGMANLTITNSTFSNNLTAGTQYSLYTTGAGVNRPGQNSADRIRTNIFKGIRCEGFWLRNAFGGSLTGLTDVSACEAPSVFFIQGERAVVKDCICTGTGQYGFQLNGPFTNGALLQGNVWGKELATIANSSMFFVTQTSADVHFIGNVNYAGGNLIRATTTAVTVGVCKNNVCLRTSLYNGPAGSTILASDGNIYRSASPVTGFTITTQGVDLRVP